MDQLVIYLNNHDLPWAITGSSAIKYWNDKIGSEYTVVPDDIDVLIGGTDKLKIKELATGFTKIKNMSVGKKSFKSVYESADGKYDFIRNSGYGIDLTKTTDGYLNLPELLLFYETIFREEDEATALKIAPKLPIIKDLMDSMDIQPIFVELIVHPLLQDDFGLLW